MAPARRLVPGLALIAAGAGAVHAQPADAPFDSEERRRLVAGELVRRPQARREGPFRYVGGTSWQRVDAPPAAVFDALLDARLYPALLPGVEAATVVVEGPRRRIVRLRHRYALVEASYHVVLRVDRRARTIRFELDRTRPRDVRAGRGVLKVEPYREGSIVAWGVLVDVGGGLVTGLLEPLLREWLLRVPSCVRAHFHPEVASC